MLRSILSLARFQSPFRRTLPPAYIRGLVQGSVWTNTLLFYILSGNWRSIYCRKQVQPLFFPSGVSVLSCFHYLTSSYHLFIKSSLFPSLLIFILLYLLPFFFFCSKNSPLVILTTSPSCWSYHEIYISTLHFLTSHFALSSSTFIFHLITWMIRWHHVTCIPSSEAPGILIEEIACDSPNMERCWPTTKCLR